MNDTETTAHLYARLLAWLEARHPGSSERAGARLALLYATNAVDPGEGGSVVDTLLHPVVEPEVLAGPDPAVAARERSVLRILTPGAAAPGELGLDPADNLDELLRGFRIGYEAISQDPDSFCAELAGEEVMLPASDLGSAVAKVRAMGPEDRQRQEWMIEAAFAARGGPVLHWCLAAGSAVDAGVPDPQRLLDQAAAVARELGTLAYRDAYRDGRRVGWLGLEPLEDGRWTVLPAGLGLGHGYSGVALFLAQLGELTGRSEHLELAAEAVAAAPALVEALAERPAHLAAIGGGFAGLDGVAYALDRLSVLLDSGELRRAAKTAAELAARAAEAARSDPAADPAADPVLADLFNDSWCRGVARLAATDALDATDLTLWLARLATTPPLGDLTVCHGEFGLLEALAILAEGAAADVTSRERARATLARRVARLPDPVASGAAFSGTPGAVPTPGFLHGLAGVGYGLLRVAFPDRVPSVLTMQARI